MVENAEYPLDDAPTQGYFVFGGEFLGRVTYDPRTGDYLDGEILTMDGQWQPHEAGIIIADGIPVTKREAKKFIKRNHGRLLR